MEALWVPEPKRKPLTPIGNLTTIPHLIELFNFHFKTQQRIVTIDSADTQVFRTYSCCSRCGLSRWLGRFPPAVGSRVGRMCPGSVMLRAPPMIAMSVGHGLISNPTTVWPTTAFIAADLGGPSNVVDWRVLLYLRGPEICCGFPQSVHTLD